MNFVRPIVVLSLALASGVAFASSCPPHAFTEPADVRLRGDAVLIVTHATSTYDARLVTKRGVDEAVRFAKSRGIPVVYLQDDSPPEHYFAADCEPDYWVRSQDGEIAFDVPPAHVYVAGGHLENCLAVTLNDLIYRWSKRAPRNHTITYLMDAIYSNGKLVEPGDPFQDAFQRFIGIVTHGRPNGEHWPKVSLLETMGVIVREDDEIDYLTRAMPRWERTFASNVRVKAQVNGMRRKVLRPAEGPGSPTMFFHFVDSAVNLATAPFQDH
ncbi:MAG: hypothetical protein ABI585_12985 [Betaproteobacteria bacterium]